MSANDNRLMPIDKAMKKLSNYNPNIHEISKAKDSVAFELDCIAHDAYIDEARRYVEQVKMNLAIIRKILRAIEDEWRPYVKRTPKHKVVDIAVWMVNRQVTTITMRGETVNGNLPIEILLEATVDTLTCAYTFKRDGNRLLIKSAVRHDPSATYRA